ncbi:MAG: hypothetical protein JWO05_1068 [Gemmatimonadetes bacterium]|nr:hypothetical protein [Gemmatimonadota bacterium]
MSTLAVVDDRPEVRDLVGRRLTRALKDEGVFDQWELVLSPPLATLSLYPGWVAEQEVSVLLLDQRLNEAADLEPPYTGHDILNLLRPREFDLPIYYVTEIPNDALLEADSPRVSGILSRSKLTATLEDTRFFVREFIREGQRYDARVARKLARLSQIASLIVAGTANEEELKEAAAIREEFQLPFASSDAQIDRAQSARFDLLNVFEEEISSLESLATELRGLIAESAPEEEE